MKRMTSNDGLAPKGGTFFDPVRLGDESLSLPEGEGGFRNARFLADFLFCFHGRVSRLVLLDDISVAED
jgi:hypothetical protein